MAPVNRTPTSTRGRAQLVLVGGLALAVTIVVLALVLNSAIYSHNLASRSDSAASEALTFEEDTRHGVGGLLDSVNTDEVGDDFVGLQSDYGTGLESWERSTRNWTASNGRAVSVTAVSEREGVRIVDDSGSNFYPADGTTSPWTVAKDVRVRRFEMEVVASGLTSVLPGDLVSASPFNVTFHRSGSVQHRVSIYEDSSTSDITVTVDEVGSGTVGTCTVSRSDAIVDFTDAELETQECEPLDFLSSYDGPYDVRYHNPGSVSGSYELTVDRVIDGPGSEVGAFTDAVDTENFGNHCSGPTFNPSTGAYPFVAPALYSAEVEAEFVGSDTIVRSQQRVAPDEPGTEPTAPRLVEVDVTDDSDGTDAIFDVSWTATDPDGNFQSVDVELEGVTSNAPVTSASGTVTRTVGSGAGNTYIVLVTVKDADGNTRTVRQEHVADGDGTGDGTCPE